jgi:hypothetical protein
MEGKDKTKMKGGKGEADHGCTTPAREQWRADRNAAGGKLLSLTTESGVFLHLFVADVSEKQASISF